MPADTTTRSLRRRFDRWLLLTLGVLLLTLSPVGWLLMMSFKTEADALAMPPKLFFVPTFENYSGLLETRFLRPLLNSVVVATVTTVLSLALGVPAAYALSRTRTW